MAAMFHMFTISIVHKFSTSIEVDDRDIVPPEQFI